MRLRSRRSKPCYVCVLRYFELFLTVHSAAPKTRRKGVSSLGSLALHNALTVDICELAVFLYLQQHWVSYR